MRDDMRLSGFVLGIALAIVTLIFVVGTGWILFEEVTAQRREALRRSVFEESASYRHGTLREIRRMQMEMAREPDPAFKRALRSMAVDQADTYEGDMPEDLRVWIEEQRALVADGK